MEFTLETALQTMYERQQKGDPLFYRPLPGEASKIVREYYRTALRRMAISEHGCDESMVLKNDCGTVIARGYRRVVVGDYGAYIEFTKNQLIQDSIAPKWPGEQKKEVSYIWYQTKDASQTKVYLQQHKVQYADYRPGMYYVAPDDVFIEQVIDAASKEWRAFKRVECQQHGLEAKRAAGGEVVGDPINKEFAKENQWLCRNPENGHTWVCGDQNFRLLYRLTVDDGSIPQPKKKTRKQRGNQAGKGRKKLNEAAVEAASAESGPLFSADQ
jgi:hypothetical protein